MVRLRLLPQPHCAGVSYFYLKQWISIVTQPTYVSTADINRRGLVNVLYRSANKPYNFVCRILYYHIVLFQRLMVSLILDSFGAKNTITPPFVHHRLLRQTIQKVFTSFWYFGVWAQGSIKCDCETKVDQNWVSEYPVTIVLSEYCLLKPMNMDFPKRRSEHSWM